MTMRWPLFIRAEVTARSTRVRRDPCRDLTRLAELESNEETLAELTRLRHLRVVAVQQRQLPDRTEAERHPLPIAHPLQGAEGFPIVVAKPFEIGAEVRDEGELVRGVQRRTRVTVRRLPSLRRRQRRRRSGQ